MWCMKCNHDLSECTCPDLRERLERLRNCQYLHTPTIVDKPLAALDQREKEVADKKALHE